MVEVVLVSPSVLLLYNVESRQLRQYDVQQAAALQVHEALAGVWRHDYLVQLHLYALAAHYLDAVGHALQRLECLVLNLEVQLCGEAYATHHA